MKTNVTMTRKMGDFEVLQRTSDSMFNATKLLEQWNKSNPDNQRRLDKFWESTHLPELMELIFKNEYSTYPIIGDVNEDSTYRKFRDVKNNSNTVGVTGLKDDSNTPIIGELKEGSNTRKIRELKKVLYKTSRGRSDRGGGTWMHYALFSEFASWVSLDVGVLFKNMLIEDGIVDKQPIYSIVRNEKRFLSVIESALSVCSRYNSIHNQYSIGKYFVDMALIHSYMDEFSDENGINKEYKSNKYILIEYDENHHLKPSVSKYDAEREFEICKNLKSKHINEEIDVTIIRISENMESYAYAYLLPYLTGVETSYSFDKACEFLDIRNLISSEHNLDITTENKKYDYDNH